MENSIKELKIFAEQSKKALDTVLKDVEKVKANLSEEDKKRLDSELAKIDINTYSSQLASTIEALNKVINDTN